MGALTQSGLEDYVIVGGVAVAARLGQAHRGTTDVDTVIDEVADPDAIETLLALPDAQADPTGAHRVRLGGTKVEIIGVGPVDDSTFDGLTDMQTLFVAAHTWALSTPTPLTLVAGSEPTVRATGPFATPAALFAMKLNAIEARCVRQPRRYSQPGGRHVQRNRPAGSPGIKGLGERLTGPMLMAATGVDPLLTCWAVTRDRGQGAIERRGAGLAGLGGPG